MEKITDGCLRTVADFDYGGMTEIEGKALNLMASELLELRERTSGVCNWKEDMDGVYFTDCDHSFFFDSGTATENEVNYCNYCGKKIVDVPYVEPEDE